MPASGKGLSASPVTIAHLLFALHLPGSWIPGCSPWLWYLLLLSQVWQLITFPLKFFWLALCSVPASDFVSFDGLGWGALSPWPGPCRTMQLSQRWRWHWDGIRARGIRRIKSCLSHSSLPSRKIYTQNRHLPLSLSSKTWTLMWNFRKVGLNA